MMFEKTIIVPKDEAEQIDRYLTIEPASEDECLGIDDTISYTADFGNGIEIDIKCCGVDFDDSQDAYNTAWTEAVLFENGLERDSIDGECDFFGDWELEYDENEYLVHVVRDK